MVLSFAIYLQCYCDFTRGCGSIKYNALEIDKVSLIFIQNLAFFDIWAALNFFLPRFISLIAGGWVLGDVLCHITGSLNTFPIYSEVSIVLLITFYRLYTLKDPLNVSLTALHAKIIIVIVCIFNSWYVVALLIQRVRPYYSAAEFGCITLNVDDYTINICNTVATFLNVVVPMIVIILGNFAILIIAAKIAKNWGKRSRKALFTISVICWTFACSLSPVCISIILGYGFHIRLPNWFGTFAKQAMALNVAANPIIYTTNNQHFKKFLLKWIYSSKRFIDEKRQIVSTWWNQLTTSER